MHLYLLDLSAHFLYFPLSPRADVLDQLLTLLELDGVLLRPVLELILRINSLHRLSLKPLPQTLNFSGEPRDLSAQLLPNKPMTLVPYQISWEEAEVVASGNE